MRQQEDWYINMSQFSSFGSNGDIPIGDKQRMEVTTVTYGSEATILNVASGGAVIRYIEVESETVGTANGACNVVLDNIKVTYDGASERTLTHGGAIINGTRSSGTGQYAVSTTSAFIPCTAKALSTAVIKINLTATNFTARI
jgi:hypothetical protein